jgi:hypothetical protein
LKNIKVLFLLLLSISLFSCEKEEDLWTLPPRGPEKMESVELGPNYENVIYFKLETGSKVQHDLLKWDLAFASGANEHHIVLNGGKSVQIYNTNDTDFSKSYSTDPVEWAWDNPNGDKDSTAVGDWFDSTSNSTRNMVYVLDLGSGNPQFKKIRFLSVSSTAYTIRVANMDNSSGYVMSIPKKSQCNYTYFNIADKTVTDHEPPSKDWDIVFTRYRHVYYDRTPITPYVVNGVLINTKTTLVYETTSLKFEDITASVAAGLGLSKKADEIGFDWKYYDLSAGKYSVNSNMIFILKDQSGYYYKLKFIDFYNDQGAKGYPKFLYQRL